MTPEAPIELFYSYAQEDEKWHAELEKSLSELRRHQINTWSYQQIIAGQDRLQEIDSHLNAAQVILLLISRHYLASDHCYTEMQRAIERHRARTAHVIPILLSPCDWQNAPFAHLQPLPTNQEPITHWSHLDEALLKVAQGIRHAIENLSLRPQNEEKTAKYRYHVFLCYNIESKEDKRIVEKIGNQLRKSGIIPWFGEWEVRRGTSWQREIEQQIEYISAVAVFVGQEGVGPWQKLEIDALLREFVNRGCPVIPVLLQNASSKPRLPIFLNGVRWIDFADTDSDEASLETLIWGITGKHVETHRRSSHILIAPLGESPITVSAMYDLLTKQIKLTIDQVIILHPKGENIDRAYKLIRETLADACELQRRKLPFEDVDSWTNAFLFLKELYMLLDACQARGDSVYLSLVGGRTSMSALMAWVAPFFSCIKHLYHIIDLDEEHFLSIDDLELDLNRLQRKVAMHPNPEQLTLVDIPFEPRQQINQQPILRLLTATEDELAASEDELERIQYEKAGKILDALVTERVMRQFRTLSGHDRKTARGVKDHLERMKYTRQLRSFHHLDSFIHYNRSKPAEFSSVPLHLHLFRSSRIPIRVIFYTQPKDIYTALDDDVEQVVICELDVGKREVSRPLDGIVAIPDFSIKSAYSIDNLPSFSVDSVLIVPLGKSPLVATQLYTLLERQEGHNIHEVILVYPARAREIANGADLIEKALQEEADVPCIHAYVPDLEDINSPGACQSYQATLEAMIDHARSVYPDCTIDLALSAGRKGMTAMSIFAAQKKHLPYVYHILITDEQFGERIDQQTTVEALTNPDCSREERNKRLFLRAYEDEGVYTELNLIKIPVFSP